jgi:predicted nuclease of predicted toxin-antitoxin system
MRFLLDESADFPLAALLRERGHDVTAIAHDYPASLKDSEVLAIARDEQRILLTNDRDFGEMIVRQRLPHSGVILFRLGFEDLQTKWTRLEHVLVHHPGDLQDLIVITDHRVRVRRTGHD